MSLIEVKGLNHRFSNSAAGLFNIDLSVDAGELMLICGPNGSGKTTLLRHINGLLLPESGTVSVSHIDIAKDPAGARRLVGMVFQDADSQIIGETVYEDTAFGPENLRLSAEEIQERVTHALSVVEMSHLSDQKTHLLSAGEKRRLAIAGVLAMNPQIILMDEPFANLDYPGVKGVLAHILALREDGQTVVIATHDLRHIHAHADRIVIMEAGNVVRNGAPNSLVDDFESYGVEAPCRCQTESGDSL